MDTSNNKDKNENPGNHRKGSPFLAIAGAVLLLFLLSLLPWNKMTNGLIKDFNILSSIFPSDDTSSQANEILDTAYLEALKEEGENAAAPADTQPAHQDTLPVEKKTVQPGVRPATQEAMPDRDVEAKPSRVGGEMAVEDYTDNGTGLLRFKTALYCSSKRPVRIAVIGDSYIEGDIFTQDIRSMLQNRYGGNGVGYMPAHSIVQGFRTTVNHSDKGWATHGIRDKGNSCKYYSLPGEYFTGNSGASVTFKGKNSPHLGQWDLSRLLFIAPADGTITFTTDNGSQTFDVTASDQVQQILLPETTGSLRIDNNVPGLVYLGAWLEDATGVVVDNMSLRGYSGITHRNLDPALAAQMRQYVDYDLIVVEYGINALSSSQSDYKAYGNMMSAVVARLKQCYPNADIVMMGIGDRGQKVDGAVHSIPTARNMVDAQRRAARNAAVNFWDTREAMGGKDAVIEWRNQKLVNADYIHLNSKGGQRLAELFVSSLLR